tara:strand:- start:6030 stop:6737 length:708 start_codon:yes stop_codon:yes gene_type:complete
MTGLYEEQLARIERTKQFKADTMNTELMLTRHFNKILGKPVETNTPSVYVSKITGERTSACQTCNFDVYATERGIDLNAGFDIVKNPLGQGFSIRQDKVDVSLSPEKLTNIRNLIHTREINLTGGISSSFDALRDNSITVDTNLPPSNVVNTSGLGVYKPIITNKSSNPRANQENLNSVQNKEIIYGDQSLTPDNKKSELTELNTTLIHGGIASGGVLALTAIAILALSRRKKKN